VKNSCATRYADLVALAPHLCREAISAGRGVNESHLLVHQVLAQMLHGQRDTIPADDMPATMVALFRNRLTQAGTRPQA
jgi:hypothetical protein